MEKALNSGKVFKVLRKNLARGVRVSEICDVEKVRDAVLPAEKKPQTLSSVNNSTKTIQYHHITST